MKHLFQPMLFPLLIAGLLFFACTKDRTTNQTTLPTINTNKPPFAVAGPDQTINLPINSILLNGSASSDPEGKITRWHWTKISGPASFSIVNVNKAQPQVTNLEEGIYQFELTVTDSLGLFDKDSTIVTVNKTHTNEKRFSDQAWLCWWGCWIEIPNLYSYLPAGINFRVFIKRDNSIVWEEVFPLSQNSYGYWVESNGLLVVYGDELGNDTPDIIITY